MATRTPPYRPQTRSTRTRLPQALKALHHPTRVPAPATLPPRPSTLPPRNADRRLFVRLGRDSPLRDSDPAGFRSFLYGKVPEVRKCLNSVSRTDSGWSLLPAPNKDQQLYELADQIAEKCGATTAEPNDPWVHFKLPTVPYRIRGIDDDMSMTTREVSEGELAAEVERAFGVAPVQVRWGQHSAGASRTHCALATFRQVLVPAPPKYSILFDESTPVVLRQKASRVSQCGRCWGFHRQDRCQRLRRCRECAG